METATQFNKTQWNNIFKFINKKDVRKSLRGIHFTNEYAVATDSHRMVFIFDDFSDKNGLTIDYDYNVLQLDNNYPDTSRFLNNEFEDTNNQFKANVTELLNVHKELLPEAKKDVKGINTMFMEVSTDERVYFYDEEKVLKFEPTTTFRTWKYDECKKAYNCKYMIDVLNVFKSFKYKEVTIKFRGKMNPISFESIDGKVKALIMPIRLY